jgi:hypothetical protein
MPSARICVFALCFALITISTAPAVFAEPAPRPAESTMTRLRGLSSKANDVIAQGTKRSATFRMLVDTISKSDLIVYIETTKKLPAGLDGRLMFLTAAGGVRYLHVQVMSGLSVEQLIAITAHELRRASPRSTNGSESRAP